MTPRIDAPATLAAVELITLAIDADNPALAVRLFEEHTAEERDRIAALVRVKIHRATAIARSRRI